MKNKKQDGLVGGLILISIGVIALLGQVVDFTVWENFGVSFVLLLGLVFLAWGIFSREAGPMIPGGILSGIGLGIVLLVNNLVPAGIEEGGIFLIVFGSGLVFDYDFVGPLNKRAAVVGTHPWQHHRLCRPGRFIWRRFHEHIGGGVTVLAGCSHCRRVVRPLERTETEGKNIRRVTKR